MEWLTLWLTMFFAVVVRAKECPDPEKNKLLENMLVKENPTQLIQDVKFSDVWVRSYLSVCECSFAVYTKKGAGYFEDHTTCRTHKGEIIVQGVEAVRETGQHGLYSLSGVYDTTNVDYKGFIYIIYADKNANAYYAFDCDGKNWNMGVQVRSDSEAQLLEKGDNEVKKSVEEARQKMVEVAKILGYEADKEFIKYKLDKPCW